MGRGVSTLRNSSKNIYFSVEFVDFYDWEEFKQEVTDSLTEMFPSLWEVDREWDGNEVSIIARNGLVEFGLSSYCGIACLGVRPVYNDYESYEGLAENWISIVWPRLVAVMSEGFQTLRRVAVFSNGESMYERMGATKEAPTAS